MQTRQNMGMFKKILLIAAIGVCLSAAVLLAANEMERPPRGEVRFAAAFPGRLPSARLPRPLPFFRPGAHPRIRCF